MSPDAFKGGPAFPGTRRHPHFGDNEGMTLRDYFAAAALTGLLANKGFWPATASKDAYEIADAMLEARK